MNTFHKDRTKHCWHFWQVCLSVCLSVCCQPYLRNQWSKSYQIWQGDKLSHDLCIRYKCLVAFILIFGHMSMSWKTMVCVYFPSALSVSRWVSEWCVYSNMTSNQYVPIPLIALQTIGVGETGSISVKVICIVLGVLICNFLITASTSNTWLMFKLVLDL